MLGDMQHALLYGGSGHMESKRFPVAGTNPPLTIPWEVAELAYAVYSQKYGYDQSLERLGKRGGFYSEELDTWYGPHWREVAR